MFICTGISRRSMKLSIESLSRPSLAIKKRREGSSSERNLERQDC